MNSWPKLSTFTLSAAVAILALLHALPSHADAEDRRGESEFAALPTSAQVKIYAVIARDISAGETIATDEPLGRKPGAPQTQAPDSQGHRAALTASDGAKNNELGYSVAISGNTVVVGAPYATVDSKYAQGAAYIFQKPPSGWTDMTEVAKLTSSEAAENAFFGSSVAISGDTVVVGSDGANVGAGQYQGAAYVFVRPAGGWTNMKETAKLTASDGATYAYFGSSVAVSGDTVFIGADGATVGGNKYQGAAYVFEKPATGWTSTSVFNAKLTASGGIHNSQLGYSISSSGSTIAVGARSAQIAANAQQGAVYLFSRPAGGWATATETAKLTASDGAKDDQLGYSVSMDGDTVAAGAPGTHSRGALYVFVKPASGWTKMSQTAKLTASDGAPDDQLGYSVSVSGGLVAGGAVGAEIAGNDRQGAVYAFVKPAKGWSDATQAARLTVTGGHSRDELGASLSTNGEFIVAGAVDATVGKNPFQGALHVFESPVAQLQ